MNLRIEILQQRTSVQMLQMLVKSRRASAEELAIAERRLAELEELQAPAETTTVIPATLLKQPTTEVINESPPLAENEVRSVRKTLLEHIDAKKRRLADVCNNMHLVPKATPCPELMVEAIELKAEEEELWTKFRYLERNGRLPDEPTEVQEKTNVDLLIATDERKKLAEKRSKLKKKINDLRNKKHRFLDKWKTEFDYVDMTITDLDSRIYILKNS
jgi:hypothetical protein